MRIVLDVMGSDDCPDPEIIGAIEAAKIFGDELILVGPEDLIRSKLIENDGDTIPFQVIHAADRITMQDKGLDLARKSQKTSTTSMAIGIDLVKNNQADVFITAGNTGGALATAYYRLGTISGVERPALTALFPVQGGRCVVLDIGANPDCKPELLLQFAVMGSVYAAEVLKISDPRVGLISNAEEAGKGNELIKEAYPLLQQSGLNFIGNIEGKELFGGKADVAVTDGFTGNVVLKTSEAVAKLLTDILRQELMSSYRTKLGALFAKPAFNRLKQILDPGEVGAAPLLGIDGLVFIGHGRSDAHAIVSAIRSARQAVEAGLLTALTHAIQEQIATLNQAQPLAQQSQSTTVTNY